MKQQVSVHDRMQNGYTYWLTEPVGRRFAPAFAPELTPKEMLRLGVFGGKYMTDCRHEFPATWFAAAKLCAERHDARLNYFGVNASQSLAVWRRNGWIHPQDPRGWFQWYCRYYMGRRTRRCAADQALAGDRAPCVGNPQTLRGWRSRVPPQTTTGSAALGIRQQEHLTLAIRIGISSCLLGQTVRFDGGHKRDSYLNDTFGQFVEWVPVCPEVECGLGTPRESMRLISTADGVRLLTGKSRVDHTDRMARYSERRVDELASEDLCGYVLKKDSPSCGLERVKVYGAGGVPVKSGRGIFAARLVERFPSLPVEEEGRLSDPRLRENFVERVFAYSKLRKLFRSKWNVGALVSFHTAHKLILMAHSPEAYKSLGRLVARASNLPAEELERRYTEAFMAALAVIATVRRHTNVLEHMAGYFKDRLDSASKAEMLAAIEDYRHALVPLIVPMTLLRHYVRVYDVSYLAGQLYLEPHPKELMLRNHV
jgi:uncharacterized protein YbgA (DUF1722 family)/uncharacterized protein YbbK (DUF523 family)